MSRTSLTDTPTLHIAGGRAVCDGGLHRSDLALVGDRIDQLTDPDPGGPTGRPSIDASGLIAAPGYIDLQINGGYGIDLWSDPKAMERLATLLPRHGVTAFCPTIISAPPAVITSASAAVTELRRAWTEDDGDDGDDQRRSSPPAAEPLGLHLEGPVLAPSRRGAHDTRHLVSPDQARIDGWTPDHGIVLVTLAPELAGAEAIVRRLRSTGVVVSAGHSDASAEEMAAAVEAGVTMVTHLFNAMAPIHHRAAGLAGFVLSGLGLPAGLTAGLIADGVHVEPTMVALAHRALGPDHLVVVSDAVAATGLGPGSHRLGSRTFVADETGVRSSDGTLAGANLMLDAGVRNLHAFTGCSASEAIASATAAPARVMGLDQTRGRLEAGQLADVVLLDDELEVVATICRGRLAYLRPVDRGRLRGAIPPIVGASRALSGPQPPPAGLD